VITWSFPSEQWKALTQRIEQIVGGQHNLLLPLAPEVEREAQGIATLLLNKCAGSYLLSAAIGNIIGHMVQPGSELYTH